MPNALIVEDEPEANRLLAMLVKLRGFQTESAFTGGEALAVVRDRPPDIVFLDLMLPDVNGYEVCRSLKSGKETSLIPVVMVTARVEAENRRVCFGIGADDYIPKPYMPNQIFQALADADAWRLAVEGDANLGEVHFHAQDDDALKRLARLRNLLVARTALDCSATGWISAALEALWCDAQAWGRASRVDDVATLTYEIQPDHVAFALRDDSGWLASSPLAPADRWPVAFPPAHFEAFEARDGGRTWTWRRDIVTS